MTTQRPGSALVDSDASAPDGELGKDAPGSGSHKTKAISVNLDEELLRRLKVIAVVKDTPISALIESYLANQVRRDLKKVVAKLTD